MGQKNLDMGQKVIFGQSKLIEILSRFEFGLFPQFYLDLNLDKIENFVIHKYFLNPHTYSV